MQIQPVDKLYSIESIDLKINFSRAFHKFSLKV